jgi:hypothetical protein
LFIVAGQPMYPIGSEVGYLPIIMAQEQRKSTPNPIFFMTV